MSERIGINMSERIGINMSERTGINMSEMIDKGEKINMTERD